MTSSLVKYIRLLGFSKNLTQSPWSFCSSYYYCSTKKTKPAPLQERKMMDRFKIWVKGGVGGNGCSSVRRSLHNPRGKPDGGNGGRGGDVIMECCPSVWDFSGLQHHVKAQKGRHGTSKNRIGSRGDDKVVLVPVGTVIHLIEGKIPVTENTKTRHPHNLDPWEMPGSLDNGLFSNVSDNMNHCPSEYKVELEGNDEREEEYDITELTMAGQRMIVACGGEGGLGNVAECEDANGRLGSEAILMLELKSIADVGLVGMPNAGKSTLLGSISRARPVIGHYAFTTLRPNIGNLRYEDFFSVMVADIPGLISGAHENRGLGHAFLRHIERTRVLVYVVDLVAGIDGRDGIPPWEQLRSLVLELEHYKNGLSDRPSLVVANKIDENRAEEMLVELKHRVKGIAIFPVCAVLEDGVPELKHGIRLLVNGDESSRLSLDQINVY